MPTCCINFQAIKQITDAMLCRGIPWKMLHATRLMARVYTEITSDVQHISRYPMHSKALHNCTIQYHTEGLAQLYGRPLLEWVRNYYLRNTVKSFCFSQYINDFVQCWSQQQSCFSFPRCAVHNFVQVIKCYFSFSLQKRFKKSNPS